MIFRVLLTPPNRRFRARLARILWQIADPELLVRQDGATYFFQVPEDRVKRVRQELAQDILPWGAVVTEYESVEESPVWPLPPHHL